LAVSCAGLVGLAAIWELLARTGALPVEVPPPTGILAEATRQFGASALWEAVARTLETWALAMALSLLAIPAGVVLGISDTTYRACWFMVEFCRTIPPVVILPLAILQFGVTLRMELLVVVFSGAWTILYNTIYGARDVDPIQMQTARVYGISRIRTLIHVVLPTAAPFIATGVRIASAGALLLTLLAELVGGAPGIGQQIVAAQQSSNYEAMYAFIGLTGILGLILNELCLRMERRVLRWHPSYRGASS
jgi:ABC-type nitrate/sulfonate/bicarbonate transport system permease component